MKRSSKTGHKSSHSTERRQNGRQRPAIENLLEVMARLRSPKGCPWDREQNHMTLRFHAVEEVYELIDAIETGDDNELAEELGDLLLQVVFHCQLANERDAFNFEEVARTITEKLIRRHPHVFGDTKVRNVNEVWANWEKIKRAEKHGTKSERPSALDGIPRHLPALLKASKLIKKAYKAGLLHRPANPPRLTKSQLAKTLFIMAETAQTKGWNAEELLLAELRKRERVWRRAEKTASRRAAKVAPRES